MITSFEIKNFRLFDKIKIKKIKRVNLIVGKNNSGKSALLEAFLLYFSRMSPSDLSDIITSRQEYWGANKSRFSRMSAINPVRHFFKNHILPGIFSEGFTLSSQNYSFEVKIAGYIYEQQQDGNTFRKRITEDNKDAMENSSFDMQVILDDGSKQLSIMSLDDDIRDLSKRHFLRNITSSRNIVKFQYVPTLGISNTKASLLWDSISLTELEVEVVKGLQLVEPSVRGITIVDSDEGRSRDGRIPLVKLDAIDEPVPLKSLGDGMTRVYQIILSLVCAKDGVLIVDEFENGLHWSVQEDVWKIVFKLAEELNVQVFTTTHSRDCVSAFETAWRDSPDDGAFLRVSKECGYSTVKEYDLDLLSDSIESDVEVR